MFPIARFRVEDRSMEPTLSPGDYIFVDRRSYRRQAPARGELVAARDPENPAQVIVKRVADTADGSCFLVGDNPALSRDSRAFGRVPHDLLVGRVWRTAKP